MFSRFSKNFVKFLIIPVNFDKLGYNVYQEIKNYV